MIILWVLVGIIILGLFLVIIALAILLGRKTCPPPSGPESPTYGSCTPSNTYLVSSRSREFQYYFRVNGSTNIPITQEQYDNNDTLPIWVVASELQKVGIPYDIAMGLQTYNGVWYYLYPNQMLQPLFVLYNYGKICAYTCVSSNGNCQFDCHNVGQNCTGGADLVGDNVSQAKAVHTALIKYGIMSS